MDWFETFSPKSEWPFRNLSFQRKDAQSPIDVNLHVQNVDQPRTNEQPRDGIRESLSSLVLFQPSYPTVWQPQKSDSPPKMLQSQASNTSAPLPNHDYFSSNSPPKNTLQPHHDDDDKPQ